MPQLKPTVAATLLMVLATVCWGVSFIWIKIGLRTIDPVNLAALRYSLASGVLIAMILPLRSVRRQVFSPTLWRVYLPIGFAGTFLPNVLQNYGMRYLNAGISAVVQGAGPIYTSLLAAVFLKESFGIRKATGAGLAISGTAFLSLGNGSQGASSLIGVVLVSLSAVSYSVYTVMMRRSLLRLVNPFSLLVGTFSAGTLQLLAVGIPLDPTLGLQHMETSELKLILALSLISTVVAYVCYVSALKRLEASKTSYFIFLVPVFGLFLSWIFLKEVLTCFQAAMSILILSGVLLAQAEKSKV